MEEFEVDKAGNLVLHPVLGLRVATVPPLKSVLVRLQYAISNNDPSAGHRTVQVLLSAEGARTLAQELSNQAAKIEEKATV